jgi:hypothetical protein
MTMPPGPIAGPAAWRGADMARRDDWIVRLTPAHVAELEGALAAVRGRDLLDIRRADFPLPTLQAMLHDVRREVLDGRGFVLLRGLPAERHDVRELATLYWGIGTYLGAPLSQNAAGHVLGHVRDMGRDENDPTARIYQTTRRQYFHTDSCDIVGLLCVRTARRGGRSAIISSVTIYNELRRRRPDLAAALFEPIPTDRRGEVPAGMRPWFTIPVFSWYADRLTTMYVPRYIRSSQRLPDAPRLTPAQVEAIDLIDAIVEEPDLHLEMDFEPGDIQLLHNHQILHDRTEYEDWPEPERKRHLLRLWLAPPDARPLPPVFAQRYGSVEIGRRGGILVPGAALTVPL